MTRLLLLSLCLLVLAPLPAAARITGQPDNWHREQPETRDLASIRRAGVLKVLVNQSRNSSGEVKGEPIGVEYRRLRAFEQYLNSRSPSARNLTLKLIPKPKDQLLAALQRGEGDLVAPANCCRRTTACRSARARRCAPMCRWCWWRARATGATRAWSSCRADHPAAGRQRRRGRHRTGQPAPGATPHGTDPDRKAGRFLAVEDVMEMVQAGILGFTVVEQPIAERWAKVLPKLRVDRHLVLDNRADMAWYVRRDASTLRATIDRFLADYRAPADQDVAFQRVYRRAYKVRNPSARRTASAWKRSVHCCSATRGRAAWTGWRWRRWPTGVAPEPEGARFRRRQRADADHPGGGARRRGRQCARQGQQRAGRQSLPDQDPQAVLLQQAPRRTRERLAFTLAAYNMGPERVQNLRARRVAGARSESLVLPGRGGWLRKR